MVAAFGFLTLEIKDEVGNTVVEPVNVRQLNVHIREIFGIRQYGELNISIYGNSHVMDSLFFRLTQPSHFTRYNLHIKREPNAESYNIFKDCFLVNYSRHEIIREFSIIEMEWGYQLLETTLQLPIELEPLWNLNAYPPNPPRKDDILDWRQYGF